MKKKIIAIALTVCLICSAIPLEVVAIETTNSTEEEKDSYNTTKENSNENILDASSAAAVTIRTVEDVVSQLKFSGNGGHGFAAEQGNNLIDKIKGNNAIVVGDDNIKNGADRIIINRDGSVTKIQDKYYSTARATINACFDETGFRYVDGDGNLMQIEVPKDQYEAAVLRMEQKIRAGKVQGVTDPAEAKNIVRKGNLTYQQAQNLAKAGTVESLTYDAVHGVITAGGAFGISTLLNYTVCRLNGEDRETALKISAIEGLKTSAGVFGTAVIAGQLSKTGIKNVFKPSTQALTKALGEDFSKKLLKAYGQRVLAEEGAIKATQQAAELLRSTVLVDVVTTVVFTIPDVVDVFRERISKKQFVKNFAVTAFGVVAGTVGYGIGGAVGNLIVPGVGTIPGGIVGSILFGTGGGLVADLIADYITEDDADVMYTIVENNFAQLCEDYMVNEGEAKHIADGFSVMLNDDMYKDMYQSKEREEFITNKLEPLFEEEVSQREVVELPTEEEMRWALKEELKGVIYVH